MRGHEYHSSRRDRHHAVAGRESCVESTCFADEVVVDFPSVAQALHRIRRAFLSAEHGEPTVAAVQLSASEARRGAIVPLDVNVRRTCDVCGGRGEAWAGACVRCAGSGAEQRRHRLSVTVPAGVVSGMHVHVTFSPPHDPPTHIKLQVVVA